MEVFLRDFVQAVLLRPAPGFRWVLAKVLACLASVLLYLNGDLNAEDLDAENLPQVSDLAMAIQEEINKKKMSFNVFLQNL